VYWKSLLTCFLGHFDTFPFDTCLFVYIHVSLYIYVPFKFDTVQDRTNPLVLKLFGDQWVSSFWTLAAGYALRIVISHGIKGACNVLKCVAVFCKCVAVFCKCVAAETMATRMNVKHVMTDSLVAKTISRVRGWRVSSLGGLAFFTDRGK